MVGSQTADRSKIVPQAVRCTLAGLLPGRPNAMDIRSRLLSSPIGGRRVARIVRCRNGSHQRERTPADAEAAREPWQVNPSVAATGHMKDARSSRAAVGRQVAHDRDIPSAISGAWSNAQRSRTTAISSRLPTSAASCERNWLPNGL
jgi:hypothetical protein